MKNNKRSVKSPCRRFLALLLVFVISCTLISCAGTTSSNDSSEISSESSSSASYDELPSNSGSNAVDTSTAAEGQSALPENSIFEVFFLDVGQADAALVLCDGQSMLIDGGNAADSNLIYAFLQKHNTSHLNYIVATHAHEDHIGGLSGALNYATVDVAYAPVTSYDSTVFNNFVTYLAKQNKEITVPSAGDNFALGSASVSVLGPVRSSSDANNTSIVLRIVYGNTSFLFVGDAEREEEQDILNAGYALDSTVLKVGHHGSETSTTYPFLREIMPAYAVISVGAGNSYGHPTEETLSRLRDANVKVYRTDMQGDILCTSDGHTVTISVARNADVDTLGNAGSSQNNDNSESSSNKPETSSESPVVNPVLHDYIVNTNTGKFHTPGCGSAKQIKESNKLYFTGSRDELIAQGYDPCKKCNP